MSETDFHSPLAKPPGRTLSRSRSSGRDRISMNERSHTTYASSSRPPARSTSESPARANARANWKRAQSMSPGSARGVTFESSYEKIGGENTSMGRRSNQRQINTNFNSTDERQDREEVDNSMWDSRDEEEGETPKSRNGPRKVASRRQPPRPSPSSQRIPEAREEQEHSFNGTEDDSRTVFTEQQEARKVRQELEQLLNNGGDIAPQLQVDDRRTRHYHHYDSHRDDDDDHSVISRKSHHGRNDDNDDHSVVSKKSYHGRYDHDDDDNQSVSSLRSIVSNRYESEVNQFRKKLDSDAQFHRGGGGPDNEADEHHQGLNAEFDSLMAKMKRDNSLLRRKYYHEKQKNQDLAYEMQLAKEEVRGLKHELRAMDTERDELEDRMASTDSKLKKTLKKQKEVEEAMQAQIDALQTKLKKSENSVESLKETLAVASRAADDHAVASKEIIDTKLMDEIKRENQELKFELKEVNNQLHDAEIQAARVQALEKLLEQAGHAHDRDDATVSTHHISERKLDLAHSKISALEKSLSIKERTVQALEQEIVDVKNSQVHPSVEKLQKEIASLKKKLKEYEAMDLQSLLRQSQSSIEDLEKEKTRVESKYKDIIANLERKLKEKEQEISGTKESLISQLEGILGQQKQASDLSVKNMESLLSKLTQEKNEIEQTLKDLQKESKEMRDENAQFQLQLTETRSTINSLQRALNQKDEIIQELKQEVHSRVRSAESLDIRGYLESKIESLTKEKEGLEKDYSEKLNKCSQNVLFLEKELSEYQQKVQILTRELETHSSRQMRPFGDEKEIARLTAELENYRRKNMLLEETIYILKSEINELESQQHLSIQGSGGNSLLVEKLTADLEESNKRRRELERKVAEMQKLLGQAESVIAKTNAVAIKSVMDALKKKEHQGKLSRPASSSSTSYY